MNNVQINETPRMMVMAMAIGFAYDVTLPLLNQRAFHTYYISRLSNAMLDYGVYSLLCHIGQGDRHCADTEA